MKRNLRFYFALMFARGTALVLKLIGRKGTSMPGSWAIILCPDFIGRMPKPKKIIGITGTNGKTTVSNMIEDVLEDNGIEFMCNRSGTNVATGVASTLIANSHFFGKPKCDLAVFELDERSAPNIYPYMQPDIVLCTNIFRDSYKRNAHAEFILDILNKEIPKGTKLVLNGDDPLCSSIKPENDRVYFGIDHLDTDKKECDNIVNDVPACPKCHGPLVHDIVRYHHIGRVHCEACGYRSPDIDYLATDKKECDNIVNDVPACPKCHGPLVHDIVRYHHIGRVHCEACGYRSPDIDYLATDIDTKDMRMNVAVGGKKSEYPLLNSTNINIYNALAAIATLREFGLSEEKIRNSMEKMGISETRYSEKEVNGRKYILHLAKGQNPIACSRAFENIRNAPGKKSVVMFLDDYFDARHTVENTAWFYDTDFEFLNDPSIVQVVIAGARHHDTYVRTLLAGVPAEKIVHMRDESDTPAAVSKEADTVFILYDVYTIRLANDIRDKMIEREKEGETK